MQVCACRELQEAYQLTNTRSIPDWGKDIFSDLCIIMRPSSLEDIASFVKYTIALVQAHLSITNGTGTVKKNR